MDNNHDNRPSTLADRVRSLRLPDRPAANGGSTRLPWALCALLLVTSLGFGYRALFASRPEVGSPPSTGKDARSEKVASSGEVVLESKGYVIPAHQIQVSPKVSGMVVKLNVEEGMRVKKGDVLAEIERIEYESDARRAEQILAAAKHRLEELENGSRPEEKEQARAELAEAQAQLKQVKLDWQRSQRLLASGQALAVKEYEQAQASYESQERRVERLKKSLELILKGPRDERIAASRAEMQQAEAELVKAKWRLENCTVRAPVSGTILTKKAEEGNIVNPVAFNVSASLCDMADLSDLEVDLYIQERDIANVVVGQECRIMPEAFQSNAAFLKEHAEGYRGKVSRLMPIADRAKGAIPVRAKLSVPREEEGKYLKPDMSVIVSFLKPKE